MAFFRSLEIFSMGFYRAPSESRMQRWTWRPPRPRTVRSPFTQTRPYSIALTTVLFIVDTDRAGSHVETTRVLPCRQIEGIGALSLFSMAVDSREGPGPHHRAFGESPEVLG